MTDLDANIPCGVFRLGEFIGDGSTGQVWHGIHSVQEIDVAVKVLEDGTRRSWDERRFIKESFDKEIQAVTSLNHPGIVRIFEVGVTSQETATHSEGIIEGDSPYIAMEYAPDGALRHDPREMSWTIIEPLLIQLLDALAYAHSREVLHRDIKPENVLVFTGEDTTDPATNSMADEHVQYKLTDFGLAHPLSGKDMATKDVFEAGAGTPTYMAPEQLKQEWRNFGPWTDLYSLGCMVYELVCGEPPFQGKNAAAMMVKHLEKDVPAIDPEFPIPDPFADWLDRLLAKKPRDRFECAADAAYALNLMIDDSTSEPDSPVESSVEDGGSLASSSWSTDDYFSPAESEASERDEVNGEVSRSSRPENTMRQTRIQTGRFGRASGLEDLDNFQPPPPVPDSWFVELPSLPSPPIAGAGIKLVGQREVPLVDRADERDLIWESFRTCKRTEQPTVIALSGQFGVGKTRLGTWIGRRIAELGLGRTILCEHLEDSYSSNSLPRVVERFFGTWSLEKSDIAEQILQKLETITDSDADQSLKYESIQLASVALLNERRDLEDRETARQLSGSERFEVVTRLLRRLGRNRVPVIVFDDIDRSREAVEFIDHIGHLDDPPGCFFIITFDDNRDPETTELADPVGEIRETLDTLEITVEALATDHIDRFLRYLLKFDAETHEWLVELSQGYPRATIDLVRYLIDSDRLLMTDDGYKFPTDVDCQFPESIRTTYRKMTGRSLPD